VDCITRVGPQVKSGQNWAVQLLIGGVPGACRRRNCPLDSSPRWRRSALVCFTRRSFYRISLTRFPLNREGPSLQGLSEPGVRPLFRQLQSTQSSNLPCQEALRCARRNHGMPHPVSRYSVREHPDFLPITYTGVCGKSASWSGKARRREGKEAANGRE